MMLYATNIDQSQVVSQIDSTSLWPYTLPINGQFFLYHLMNRTREAHRRNDVQYKTVICDNTRPRS